MKGNTHLRKRRNPYEKSARTRENFLRAAEALFIEKGYDGVSVNDIAIAAGTTKGHIYYYFRDKRQLFDSVLEEYFSRHAGAIMKALDLKGDLRGRIHAVVDAYLDFIDENPGFPRLLQREVCSRSPHVASIVRGLEPLYEWGNAVLRDYLPQEGHLSARHFFVDMMAMCLNYYTYSPVLEGLWGYDPMGARALSERREHVHAVLDVMIDGFLKGEEAKESEVRQ